MDRRAVSLHNCPDCECVIGEAFAPRPSMSSEWARRAAIQAAKDAVDEARRKRTERTAP